MNEESVSYAIGDLLEVTWEDIITFMGWEGLDDEWEHIPHACVSVGFLTKHTDKYLSLCATKGVNGRTEYNQGISIPLGNITNIRKLQ